MWVQGLDLARQVLELGVPLVLLHLMLEVDLDFSKEDLGVEYSLDLWDLEPQLDIQMDT